MNKNEDRPVSDEYSSNEYIRSAHLYWSSAAATDLFPLCITWTRIITTDRAPAATWHYRLPKTTVNWCIRSDGQSISSFSWLILYVS